MNEETLRFVGHLQEHFEKMCKGREHLFVVDLPKDLVWDTYLDSFPAGTNGIFRERREHDCSACRHFIRDLGRVVAIDNGRVKTIWDFDPHSVKYRPVVAVLAELVASAPIKDVFVPTERKVGVEKNRECLKNGDVHVWHHMHVVLPNHITLYDRKDAATAQGRMRDTRNVFQRSLEGITPKAVETVLELIAQKSLYKGEEWKTQLVSFAAMQEIFATLSLDVAKNLFCWEYSVKIGAAIARIKNHSIGVLLTDLSENMDLDEAVRRYEKIVAPTNYKRPKAIYTKKMVERAKKTVEDLGYLNSLGRRFARLEDITVNNILFANRDARTSMGDDPFGELADDVPEKPQRFANVDEVGIETFVNDVLPFAESVEVMLENKLSRNFVSLIAPENKDAKTMFKWGNNFSWAYTGNIADSMKERVKSFGGKVDGVLRFSIQWNDNDDNMDDLDAHCLTPTGRRIYFGMKYDDQTAGQLDVDIVYPERVNGPAVENITWPHKQYMREGKYAMQVHCYTSRGATSGFTAEIEIDGDIYSFEHPKPLRQNEMVDVANVHYDGERLDLEPILKDHLSQREVWKLLTNKFHPVTVAMFSPNYWDGNNGVGHRHYFFMLQGCENPESPNGFFNEYLDNQLMEHKRVFEALGSKMKVKDTENQLSGLGFSSTKRSQIICRVKGNFERVLKVNL